MTEQQATDQPATPQLPEAIDNAFAVLRDNPAYAGVVPMLADKLGSHYALVKQNNRNVARINAAKETDPNSAEYQDATWRRVAEEGSDPKIVATEKKYQKLVAEVEKLLKEMRELSKNHMEPALSEEQVTALRKQVNDGKSVIAESVTANAAIAEMADQMLTLAGKPIDGGIWSLMPQPESLMNKRAKGGSKSTTDGEGYATRLVEAFIDGKSTNKNVKRKGKDVFAAHFNYVAESLSREFGDKEFPGNIVTAEEVERAYYDSKGEEYRNSDGMPADHTFEFTKEIETRNGADGSVKRIPVTKSIRVVRWTKDTAGHEGKLEGVDGNALKADETPAETPASDNAEGTTNDTTMAGNVPNQA